MNLRFGAPWLYKVFFWTSICFLTQTGYSFEQDFVLNDDAFSSHAGVFEPQTSNQLNSGASLNENNDLTGHINEVLSSQVHHGDNENTRSAINFSEEIVQSTTPSLQNYNTENPDPGHPFGLLLKEHTQQKNVEGVSFPTMRHFKQFVHRMKSSFLKPGIDFGRHFQTAQDVIKNHLASNAANTDGKPQTGGFNSTTEDKAHEEADENEAWNNNRNTEFEDDDVSPKNQMPSKSLSVPDSSASLNTHRASDNQGLGVDAAHHQLYRSATPKVLNNELSDNSGDTNKGAFDLQNNDFHSTSPQLFKQIPSASFFGEDFSSAPSLDLNYFNNKMTNVMPQTPENYIQTTDYSPHSKDHLAGHQKQRLGFKFKDFQSEEPGRWTAVNLLSTQKPRSLNSYGKSVYVRAPRGQLHIPDYVPKQREIPAPKFPAYLPTAVQQSNHVKYNPPVHHPVSVGSISSSSENPSSRSTSRHVGVQTSSPHIKMKSSGALYNGYLKEQRASVTHPSVHPSQVKDEKSSNPYQQNLISTVQESKQIAEDALFPSSDGFESNQSDVSSQFGVGYETFNSPSSAPAFLRFIGNEVKRKDLDLKNTFSEKNDQRFGSIRPLDLFSAGRLQTFIQPTKDWRRPANVNREPGNTAYQHPKPPSATGVSASTLNGLLWRKKEHTKRLPQMGLMSPPSAHMYVVKSKNGYVRGKVSLSKTHYDSYQLNESRYKDGNDGNFNTKTLQAKN